MSNKGNNTQQVCIIPHVNLLWFGGSRFPKHWKLRVTSSHSVVAVWICYEDCCKILLNCLWQYFPKFCFCSPVHSLLGGIVFTVLKMNFHCSESVINNSGTEYHNELNCQRELSWPSCFLLTWSPLSTHFESKYPKKKLKSLWDLRPDSRANISIIPPSCFL